LADDLENGGFEPPTLSRFRHRKHFQALIIHKEDLVEKTTGLPKTPMRDEN
jgi:hypothetical protein